MTVAMLDRLLLEGDKVTGDLREALAESGLTLEQTIDGASVLRMQILDPDRTFVRSEVFNQRSITQIDDVRFELSRVQQTDLLLTLEWEDWIVASLRARKGSVTAAQGTTTRGEFARRLADEAGVPCEFEPGETIRTQIGRGITDPEETSWACLQRIAGEVDLRCLSDGRTLLFGSDEWLRSRAVPLEIRELDGGIGRIDFTTDIGIPADRARLQVTADRWTLPAGLPVDIADLGPATGEWLVSRVATDVVTAQATIDLTRQRQALPEPVHEVAPGVSGVLVGPQGSGGGRVQPDIIAAAMTHAGKPYVFGAKGPGSFDCSGLVTFAARQVGLDFPGGSKNQYARCRDRGLLIPIADAVRTYGGVLFRMSGDPTHVALSRGDGTTIEARGRRYGVGVFSATSGRAWTHGALVPGARYQ